jgi:hypothetical protein
MIIKLKIFYKVHYSNDYFADVPTNVANFLYEDKRRVHAQGKRDNYHKLCLININNHKYLIPCTRSAEAIYLDSQQQEQYLCALIYTVHQLTAKQR